MSVHTPDKSDVLQTVNALLVAAHHLQKDAASLEDAENLIQRLKHLHVQEKQKHGYKRQDSHIRGKLESLQNLVQHLESQTQRVRKVANMRGLESCLVGILNTVLGHELIRRIGQSMESELKSWLDQQGVRELVDILSNDSEDAQVTAISSFEALVRRGYDSQLQAAILSAGLVQKLGPLLHPNSASWRVQEQVAFALSSLLDFNKNIFVSEVLMAKVVENLQSLVSYESDEHILVLVCVLKSLLSAGEAITVDEIYTCNGIQTLVDLFKPLQHATMYCVFDLAYFGRIEVAEKMLEADVLRKLAKLESSNAPGNLPTDAMDMDSHGFDYSGTSTHTSSTAQPFANAVTKFALRLAIGIGLRKRERQAMKLKLLKQIKETLDDDAEIAGITADILWGP